MKDFSKVYKVLAEMKTTVLKGKAVLGRIHPSPRLAQMKSKN